MNDHLYIEERIKDLHPARRLDEVDEKIKELLEKNGSVQEEVRKLRREQEIQSVRLCEVVENKNKIKPKMKGKDNEIQHLSLKLANFINQSPMQIKKSQI